MKKNIILGVILFLLITAFCSALYYIVLIDKESKNKEMMLKAQEVDVKSSEMEKSENKSLSNENNEKPENKNNISKETPRNPDEVINIESKDDAQKVLEEANEIVETMDDISF